MGPSIYDVHTEGGRGSGSDGRMWTGEGGPAPCGCPHRKLKLESTDVILFSSHAKKLASFFIRISSFNKKKVEIFLRYKLVIQITKYSLNKLESYSRISALGPVGHCTSHFKRAVCISCRPCVDIHKGGGVRPMWTHVDRGGQKPDFFCGRHKWMTPYAYYHLPLLYCTAYLSVLINKQTLLLLL